MTRKRILMLLGSVCLALMLALPMVASCAAPTPAPTPTPVFTIKLGHHHAMDTLVDKLANRFVAEIEERSDGKMEVQVFPGAMLGQEREAIDGIHMGTLEMSIVSPSMCDRYWPVMGIETLPFTFDDFDHATRALDGPAGEALAEGLLQNSKIRVLGFQQLGFRQMFTRTIPITQLDDMKGLKMRSPEAWIWIKMFELLGAKPTPVTWGEAYLALQTGVVEGMECSTRSIVDMKFFEVTKYVSLTRHMFSVMIFVINDDFYNEMTADQQNVVREAARVALYDAGIYDCRPGAEAAAGELEELGMIMLDIEDRDAFREAVFPMWEEFFEQAPEARDIMALIAAER